MGGGGGRWGCGLVDTLHTACSVVYTLHKFWEEKKQLFNIKPL